MNKRIKAIMAGALISSSLLSFAGGAHAASMGDSANAVKQQQADESAVQVVLGQPTENCLQMFADLYLQLLEQQYTVQLQEMNVGASNAVNRLTVQAVANTSPVKPEREETVKRTAQQAASVKSATKKPAVKHAAEKTASTAKSEQAASSASGKISTASGNLSYSRVLNVKASAYSGAAEENGGYEGLDYFGHALKVGSIAVDPNVIPLGSKVFITGYSFSGLPVGGMIATAVDIGSAIIGNRVDIFAPGKRSEVSQFGFQDVKIYMLK